MIDGDQRPSALYPGRALTVKSGHLVTRMPIFIAPLHEFNTCHNPEGPGGGQFCSTKGGAAAPATHGQRGLFRLGTREGPAVWFADINRALDPHTAGQHHRGSGWSDWGDLVYEPPVKGYVVKSKFIAHDTEHRPLNRWYVDHAGAGAKAALPKYAETLRAAGFEVEIGKIHELKKKQVVWILGRR
jgi:hypothetical protein